MRKSASPSYHLFLAAAAALVAGCNDSSSGNATAPIPAAPSTAPAVPAAPSASAPAAPVALSPVITANQGPSLIVTPTPRPIMPSADADIDVLEEYFSAQTDQSNSQYIFPGTSAQDEAESFQKSGLDFGQYKDAVSYFEGLTDQSDNSYLYLGKAAFDRAELLLRSNVSLEQFKVLVSYLMSQTDQNANYVFFGVAAVDEATQLLKSGVNLDAFRALSDYLSSLTDQSDHYLFVGRSPYDLASAALADSHFDATRFQERCSHFLGMTAQDGTYMYVGQAAVQKAFDALGMQVKVADVLNGH